MTIGKNASIFSCVLFLRSLNIRRCASLSRCARPKYSVAWRYSLPQRKAVASATDWASDTPSSIAGISRAAHMACKRMASYDRATNSPADVSCLAGVAHAVQKDTHKETSNFLRVSTFLPFCTHPAKDYTQIFPCAFVLHVSAAACSALSALKGRFYRSFSCVPQEKSL